MTPHCQPGMQVLDDNLAFYSFSVQSRIQNVYASCEGFTKDTKWMLHCSYFFINIEVQLFFPIKITFTLILINLPFFLEIVLYFVLYEV